MRKIPKHNYTDEQWQAITNADCIDVAHALGLTLSEKNKENKTNRQAYHVEGYGGLFVFKHGRGWYNHSSEEKGTAIQLVQFIRGGTYKEALDFVNDYVLNGRHSNFDSNRTIGNQHTKSDKLPFALPQRSDRKPSRAYAYLVKTRGVEPEIVSNLISQKKIYQEKLYGNVVFVGCDKDNNPRYCLQRGTTDKRYIKEQEGSDKSCSFCMDGTSKKVYVFESPIDAMSHASLVKMSDVNWQTDYRLSLGGCYLPALDKFLKDNPQINEIALCLDNDKAGENTCKRIKELYGEKYDIHLKPPKLKDFNEDLLSVRAYMTNGMNSADAIRQHYTIYQGDNTNESNCESENEVENEDDCECEM